MSWIAWPRSVPFDFAMLCATVATNASLAFSLALAFELAQWLRGRYPGHRKAWTFALALAAASFSWIVGLELTHAVTRFSLFGYVHVIALSLAIGCGLSLYSLRAQGFDRWGGRKLTLLCNLALVVLLLWIQHRYRMMFREAKFVGVSAAFLLLTAVVCLRLVERLRPIASGARGWLPLAAALAVSLIGYAWSPERALRQLYFAGLYPGRVLFAAHAPELFMQRAARGVRHASTSKASTSVSSAVTVHARADERAEIVLLVMVDALRADAFHDYARAPDSKLHRAYSESCVVTTLYAPASNTSGSLGKLLVHPIVWLDAANSAGVKRSLIADQKLASTLDRSRSTPFDTQFDRVLHVQRLESGALRPLRTTVQPLLHEPGAQLIWAHYFRVHEWDREDPHAEIDRYHERVAAVGDEVAALIEHIETSVPDRRIAVILTADHGEGLDHFAARNHGEFVYEPLVRVPLMLWTHGLACPKDTAALTQKAASATIVGPLILDQFGIESAAQPAISQLATRPALIQSTMQEAIIRWPHKLIVSPWFTELFDLSTDPNERNDLSQTSAPLVAELRDLMDHELSAP